MSNYVAGYIVDAKLIRLQLDVKVAVLSQMVFVWFT